MVYSVVYMITNSGVNVTRYVGKFENSRGQSAGDLIIYISCQNKTITFVCGCYMNNRFESCWEAG